MNQSDIDRIERIQFARPDLGTNRSQTVRNALREFEEALKQSKGSSLTTEEVLAYLYRFTMENEALKADFTKVAGVQPHHSMGSVETRLSEANEFIDVIAAKKDDRILGRVFDEFLDNVEFMLWAHAASHTSEFISGLPRLPREALKSQLYYGLMIAKAAPDRPYAQRFMNSFNELLASEHLNSLRDESAPRLT